MKRQEIFANDVADKGLISKIHIQDIQLNIKKKKQTKQSNHKAAEDLNRQFSKEQIQMPRGT